MGYDVIVVGARVAGAATAMLLARQGLKVLVLDRASFPSDTVSSHQVQLPGVALLHRWGLLDPVRSSGAPATRDLRFDTPDVVLQGRFPLHDGVDALYSPRRTVLDHLLVCAARAAGAEVRENFRVESLAWSGGRVTGVRGSQRSGRSIVETARLVVGADGKHSLVASQVAAASYRRRPVRAFASYTYWAGVPVHGGAIYQRPQRTVAVFPTNDDLTMVYVSAPLTEFGTFRQDIEHHYLRSLDLCGDLGERVRHGTRAERIRTTPDQPNTFRRPHGPGWALVGDAGVVMDSITAQGISNALRDAQLLADAIVADPSGGALGEHQRRRDRAIMPMYDFTTRLARFRAGFGERLLLRALRDRPDAISRFLGAIAGVEPVDQFFGPVNALRLMASGRTGGGPRGGRNRRGPGPLWTRERPTGTTGVAESTARADKDGDAARAA